MAVSKQIIFEIISFHFRNKMKTFDYSKLKNVRGNTQTTEKIYIKIMRKILENLQLDFIEAESQRPWDFRVFIDENTTLKIEMKKTQSKKVMLNDTLPKNDVYFIIIYIGKKSKIICINGDEMLGLSRFWINDFQKELCMLKQKNKFYDGYITTYARPNFSFSIKHLIN